MAGREPNFLKKYVVFWAKTSPNGPYQRYLGVPEIFVMKSGPGYRSMHCAALESTV